MGDVNKRDYYEVLGISRNATEGDIKSTYRRLAKKYHPDMNRDNPKEATEKFKEMSEAYEVLVDSNKRAQYDRFGHAGVSDAFGKGGFDWSNFTHFSDIRDIFGGFEDFFETGSIFDMFFGGPRRRQRYGRPHRMSGPDIKIKLKLNLKEIAKGVEKKIKYKRLERCPDCGGKGGTSKETCPVCKGTGEIKQARRSLFGQIVNITSCSRCRGEGSVIKNPCRSCGGDGRVKKTATLTVKIPEGVATGNYIPMRGEGNVGPNEGPSGNLIVLIEEKEDDIFERKGNDLYCRVSISFSKAALGGEVDVPTLKGKVRLKIPSGTQSGKLFRLRGKGMPNLQGYGSGDEYVEIIVWTPTKLSSEEKRLIAELSKYESEPPTPKKGFFSKIFGL